VHYDALDKPVNDIVYFPIVVAQRDAGASLPAALSLVVRTDGRHSEALSAIRGIVHSLDPAVPTYDEGSLRELVRDASSRSRALVVLLAIASTLTSLLGAVGLYGVMAYGVSIRRRELAVRIALGARPADVRRMVSTHGLRLAGVGVVIGLACTLGTSRLLRGLLYGVSPTDFLTLSVTPIALLLVAFVASWLPARRAAAIQPAEALRSQ
jgi:ABC-type antimicrobial peptide transport system permease subunit